MNVEDLIKKLEHERYETTDPKHSVEALAYRKGHNDCKKELVAFLRMEAGIEEIKAAPALDLRLKAELTGFDTSDLGGEG